MKQAYVVVSAGVCAVGVWHVLDDLLGDDFFRGIAAIGGFAVVVTGTLNLLNHAYGATAVGVRAAAIGANLSLLALVRGLGDQTTSWFDLLLFGLLVVATVLSFSRRSWKLTRPSSLGRCFLGLMFGIGVLSNPGVAAADVEWYDDYDLAVRHAREQLQPIVLDFWAPWCGPCRMMEQEVYTNEEVKELLQRFAAVRVNVDQDLAVPARFFVKAIPTLVLLDPFGNEFTRREGAVRISQLCSVLEVIPTDYRALGSVREQISPGSKNLEAILTAADFYRNQGHLEMSTRILEQALKAADSVASHETLDKAFSRVGLNYLAIKEEKKAEKVFRKRLESCNCPNRAFLYLGLGKSLVQMGKKAKAREVYEEMLRRYPAGQLTDVAREALAAIR